MHSLLRRSPRANDIVGGHPRIDVVKALHPESLLSTAASGFSLQSLFDGQFTRPGVGSGLHPRRLRDSLLGLVLIRLLFALFCTDGSVVVLHDAPDRRLRPVSLSERRGSNLIRRFRLHLPTVLDEAGDMSDALRSHESSFLILRSQ